jgi:hypothetical protein
MRWPPFFHLNFPKAVIRHQPHARLRKSS